MRLWEFYQEAKGGTFTHDGKEYDLNSLLRLTKNSEVHDIPLDELEWVMEYDDPQTDKGRVKTADLSTPILVTWWKDEEDEDHKLVVLDGLHRIAKASDKGLEMVSGIYVDKDQLDNCRI